MNQPAPSANSKRRFSRVFLVALGTIAVLVVVARPAARWSKAQYDAYKNSTSRLLASQSQHRVLLKTIQAHQSSSSANRLPIPKHSISEKIFQAALLPDILGRSSRYEPYTHNGKLACARMVNLVIDRALGYQVGQNPLYVPSLVEDLDRHQGKRIEQTQTVRGDLAISALLIEGMNSRRGERPFAPTQGTGAGKSCLHSATPQFLTALTTPTDFGTLAFA